MDTWRQHLTLLREAVETMSGLRATIVTTEFGQLALRIDGNDGKTIIRCGVDDAGCPDEPWFFWPDGRSIGPCDDPFGVAAAIAHALRGPTPEGEGRDGR